VLEVEGKEGVYLGRKLGPAFRYTVWLLRTVCILRGDQGGEFCGTGYTLGLCTREVWKVDFDISRNVRSLFSTLTISTGSGLERAPGIYKEGGTNHQPPKSSITPRAQADNLLPSLVEKLINQHIYRIRPMMRPHIDQRWFSRVVQSPRS